jgi:hypothetical protein
MPDVINTWKRSCWDVGPGWEQNFVFTESTDPKKNHELRATIDDTIEGFFKTRDWTKSSLPYVNKEEKFWSGWWFEKRSDAEKAMEILRNENPVGSWEPHYKEVEKQRNAEREGRQQE